MNLTLALPLTIYQYKNAAGRTVYTNQPDQVPDGARAQPVQLHRDTTTLRAVPAEPRDRPAGGPTPGGLPMGPIVAAGALLLLMPLLRRVLLGGPWGRLVAVGLAALGLIFYLTQSAQRQPLVPGGLVPGVPALTPARLPPEAQAVPTSPAALREHVRQIHQGAERSRDEAIERSLTE